MPSIVETSSLMARNNINIVFNIYCIYYLHLPRASSLTLVIPVGCVFCLRRLTSAAFVEKMCVKSLRLFELQPLENVGECAYPKHGGTILVHVFFVGDVSFDCFSLSWGWDLNCIHLLGQKSLPFHSWLPRKTKWHKWHPPFPQASQIETNMPG